MGMWGTNELIFITDRKIYNCMMKLSISMLVGLLLIAIIATSQKATVLSYLVDYEEEQRQDFLELTVEVSSLKASLQEAIAEAKEKAENIKTVEEEICRTIAKSKTECKGSAEIGNVQINPKYEENKKELEYKGTLFFYVGISATYEVLIRVLNPDNFGELVDKILTLEGFVITKI
jgi:uncharacterized protein YggE